MIKQEIGGGLRKESLQVNPSSGPVSTSAITAPTHVEIKKESLGDEISSPQAKLSDTGDTSNSVSGESSCSSVLDAQG